MFVNLICLFTEIIRAQCFKSFFWINKNLILDYRINNVKGRRRQKLLSNKQKFKTKKLSVGAASVLVGTIFATYLVDKFLADNSNKCWKRKKEQLNLLELTY